MQAVSRSFGAQTGAAKAKLREDASRLGRCVKSSGLVVLMAIFLLSLMFVSSAWASFGEVAKVGGFGAGPGEFEYPSGLAVDQTNNDVFVMDEPAGESLGIASSYRIQEFSPSLGKPIASVTVQTPIVGAEGYQFIAGIAVDSALKRLYVLKGIYTEVSGYNFIANEILIYSTDASNETLTPEGTLYKFSSPIPSNDTVSQPVGIAVDPTTHNVVVLGVDGGGDALIREVTSAGQLGPSYDDTSEQVGRADSTPSGIAIGPDGSIYLTVSFNAAKKETQEPGVVKLSSDFKTLTVIHQAMGEHPPLDGGRGGGDGVSYGPQISVNPEGTVVYAAEQTSQSELGKAGAYELRGMSTSTGDQVAVYGGGKTTCEIASSANAVATGSSGVVYALDEGGGEDPKPTSYGFDLVEFGPNGTGCPAPETSFTIDGKPEDSGHSSVEVTKGEDVKLKASETELKTEKPIELMWEVSGPETAKETVTPKPPATTASVELSHRFLKPGLYTVTLNMVVSPGTLGSPPAVTRKIEVIAPQPIASFEVFGSGGLATQSPLPKEEVTFDAAESQDPTGECSQGSGCVPTHKLASYTWNFGDGSKEVITTEPKITHAFANAGVQPISDIVTLTVTNGEGEASAPTNQTLTIQGTPEEPKQQPSKELIKEAPKEVPVTKVPVVLPPGKKSPLTKAQKLALALKACKKDKSKRARASCEKAAKKKYASKPKKKKK
jgi:hypothetical protein